MEQIAIWAGIVAGVYVAVRFAYPLLIIVALLLIFLGLSIGITPLI